MEHPLFLRQLEGLHFRIGELRHQWISNAQVIGYALFFVGKLISVLGSSLYTFVAGLTVLKLTGSGSNFAVTLICGFLPRILLAPSTRCDR